MNDVTVASLKDTISDMIDAEKKTADTAVKRTDRMKAKKKHADLVELRRVFFESKP